MPEIRPDLADESRCISVHWNLPVQCVLPRGHRENWHEAWHPENGNRLRYRRSGPYRTEDLHDGEWHDLEIPPPNGFCNEHYPNVPGALCRSQYGHGWSHQVRFNGCLYSWNTPVPKGLTVDQLTRDVQQLRGMLVAAHARIAELQGDGHLTAEDVAAWLGKKARELPSNSARREGTADVLFRLADKVSRGAIRPTDSTALEAS